MESLPSLCQASAHAAPQELAQYSLPPLLGKVCHWQDTTHSCPTPAPGSSEPQGGHLSLDTMSPGTHLCSPPLPLGISPYGGSMEISEGLFEAYLKFKEGPY